MTKQLVIDVGTRPCNTNVPLRASYFSLTVVPSMPPMITNIFYVVMESDRA